MSNKVIAHSYDVSGYYNYIKIEKEVWLKSG